MEYLDFLMETNNPDSLDKILNNWGAALIGCGMPTGYEKIDGYYVVRCFSDSGFIKFAIDNQGYGKVIRNVK
jgi:hypothetical protein